jgi:DNA-binding response OmpR family regulator
MMMGHTNWNLYRAADLPTALSILEKHPVPVVLCSEKLNGATWKDILKAVDRFPNPPVVLVHAVQADDALWMEVLNSGAYDLLRTPFTTEEVLREISQAGRRWHDEARTTKSEASRLSERARQDGAHLSR